MTMRTEPVVVNVGPHHPSTHGVFRMKLTFDGENILDAEPVIGYLHRGTEKLAEERQYTQVITLTDRLDYVASMTNNQAYVLSCERLVGIEPPERGKYLRVIAAELQRVASHLIGVGLLPAGAGRVRRDGADVRVPRARAHPGHVRDAVRRAHHAHLHAHRRRAAGRA